MSSSLPQTRLDLTAWIRDHLHLPAAVETELLSAFDAVFSAYERQWRDSKQDAIQALCAGFAEKMARATRELQRKEATASSITTYFEQLVADLTEKSQRDQKTMLMNFSRFSEQLESFLSLEQRGRVCAVGLVDITQFKWYNDTLGHATGDRIIIQVAHLLREQVRADDLIARDRTGVRTRELHARFGGDEFCFLITDLADEQQAVAIGERFRQAVRQFDWKSEDPGLAERPVSVDVGLVCLRLGPVAGRRGIARHLASALLHRADELMYEAKGERTDGVRFVRSQLVDGKLVDEEPRWKPGRGGEVAYERERDTRRTKRA